jgi:hypothetical protein
VASQLVYGLTILQAAAWLSEVLFLTELHGTLISIHARAIMSSRSATLTGFASVEPQTAGQEAHKTTRIPGTRSTAITVDLLPRHAEDEPSYTDKLAVSAAFYCGHVRATHRPT